MLKNLRIVGFRAFENLKVKDLNRVNLFVGRNNTGKTAFLEAIELLQGGAIGALFRGLRRRREWGRGFEPRHSPTIEHLFHGRMFDEQKLIEISGDSDISRVLSLRIVDSDSDLDKYKSDDDDDETLSRLVLEAESTGQEVQRLPLTTDLTIPWKFSRSLRYESTSGANFVAAGGVDERIGALWGDVVLTSKEKLVTDAVRIIEPAIERIANTSSSRHGDTRFFVKLRDSDRRLPLGSMGDGVMRLLTLSIFLTNSSNGILLVDEIDTGLHYSTMVSMWKLFVHVAADMNCQVFATTHSLDCVRAIAEFYKQDADLADQITLWRIESGETQPVRYSSEDIAVSADNDMELR